MKNLISKILVCLILSSLILSSCGANEDKVGFKETVSAEQVLKQSDAKETVSAERVLQQSDAKETVSEEHVLKHAEVKEIAIKESLENNLAESSTESIDNEESEELAFYPPDGAEIFYGERTLLHTVLPACLFVGFSKDLPELVENTDNKKAYYYVCFDIRISGYCGEVPVAKALEKYGIKIEKVSPGVYVAYVTSEQIISLEKGFNEDEDINERSISVYWVAENFVEEFTELLRQEFPEEWNIAG